MKNLILTLIFTLSIPLVSNASDKYEVEVFCQDVNVLLQKFDLHAKNIVNHRTTRTVEGGYFKRKQITKCSKGFCKYKVDDTPPTLEYAPDHPDALKNGYVEYPSYAVEEERANMIRVENAYDIVMANAPVKSIDFLVGNKFADCYQKYENFKGLFDFPSYLGR